MSREEVVVPAHPEGEIQIAGNQRAEIGTSLDTFAGKVHVKWSPEATVSSLGLMPFFIEFLKTSGLFDDAGGRLIGDPHHVKFLAETAVLNVPVAHGGVGEAEFFEQPARPAFIHIRGPW